MAIIRSGWVLRPRTVTVLQPLTSQLSTVVIGWLSATDVLTTDVPGLVRVAVVALIGNSDHSSVGSHFDGSGSSKLVC